MTGCVVWSCLSLAVQAIGELVVCENNGSSGEGILFVTIQMLLTACSCAVYPLLSLQGPASECPENNQSALFKLGNFLVLSSYNNSNYLRGAKLGC